MDIGYRMSIGFACRRRPATDATCRVHRHIGFRALWSFFFISAAISTRPIWARPATDAALSRIGWFDEGTRYGPISRYGGAHGFNRLARSPPLALGIPLTVVSGRQRERR